MILPPLRARSANELGRKSNLGQARARSYVRVWTDTQTVENQINELSLVAERRGWQVVEIYRDAG